MCHVTVASGDVTCARIGGGRGSSITFILVFRVVRRPRLGCLARCPCIKDT